MKQRLPYMPLYIGDLLRETAGWRLDELGAYIKLLVVQWDNGPLPNQLDRLAAICGMPVDEFDAVWWQLNALFTRTDDGRLVHEPTEARRQQYADYRAERSRSGRKGGKASWRCPECQHEPYDRKRCTSCGHTPDNVIAMRHGSASGRGNGSAKGSGYGTRVEDEDEDGHRDRDKTKTSTTEGDSLLERISV